PSVGADTVGYLERLEFLRSMDLYWDSMSGSEPGVKVIYALALALGEDPRIFLLLASSLAVVLYLSSIRKTAALPAVGLFVFLAFGFYLFHLNGLRQGLALGFFLLALRHAAFGNFWKYLLWGVIAGLFHLTALMILPIYFLARRGVTPFNVLILIF